MEESNQSSNAAPPVSLVVQAPPIQTPPVSKPKSKLPILIIGIILFLLIVGSAAGFYVFKPQSLKTTVKPSPYPTLAVSMSPTPTLDPTANWKIYTNPAYGYSLKYPDGYVLSENKEFALGLGEKLGFSDVAINTLHPTPGGGFGQIHVEVWIFKKDGLDLAQWIDAHIRNVDIQNPQTDNILYVNPVNKKAIKINENQWQLMDAYRGEGGTYKIGLTENKNNVYAVILSDIQFGKDPNIANYYQDILATFKLTDSTTVDTSNWEKHNYNGYSIKFPREWFTGSGNSQSFTQILNYNPATAEGRGYDLKLDKGKMKVEIFTFKTPLDLNNFLEKSQSENSPTGLQYSPKNPKQIIVDGQPAIENNSSVFTQDPKSNDVYLISFVLDFGDNIELQKQILSTFKFTK